jgi:hypothetical protein
LRRGNLSFTVHMDVVEALSTQPGTSDISEKDLTDEQVLSVLAYLKAHWTKPLSETSASFEAAKRFGVIEPYKTGTLMPNGEHGLDMLYKKLMFAITRLEMQMYMRHMIDVKTGSVMEDIHGQDFKKDLNTIYMSVTQLYRSLKYDLFAKKALDPLWASECPNIKDDYIVFESQKLKNYHVFLIFVLEKLQEAGYKKYQGHCYEQIQSMPILLEGSLKRFNTHAWKKVCTIQEFVVSVASMKTTFEQWQTMSDQGPRENVIKYLQICREDHFHDLVPDRHWFSFRNGLYHTREAKFYPYGSKVPPDVVSCKYHDIEFQEDTMHETDFYTIQTPSVQKILEYQLGSLDDSESVIRWVYVFLGRLLFEVSERDTWQVILFCMGRAGTGKSCLIDAVTSFFNDEDVGVLANNSQKDFGLETFIQKLVWTCYEVKHDFTLDQANFQSMVTGEKVVIQRKNQTAVSLLWKIPGILAGNEVASWTDNSGSISRRIVFLNFHRKVISVDPNLHKNIRMEIGNLMHKCCRAYIEATRAYGDMDIWRKKEPCVLPEYFHKQRSKLVELTHPIASFLNNAKLYIVGKDSGIGMPFDRYKQLANEYFLTSNFPKFSWKVDKYKAVLEDFDIDVRKLDATFLAARGSFMEYNTLEYGPGTEWAFGVTEFDPSVVKADEAML